MPKIKRVDIDNNIFVIVEANSHVVSPANMLMICERETLADGRRGYWLLKMNTVFGPVIIARDQYSNDLVELAQMHYDGKRPIDKLRIMCSEEQYHQQIDRWIEEIQLQFGGEWIADYYQWDSMAFLFKKVETNHG